MTEIFDQELREQYAEARRALRDARSAEDEDGAQAYAGRLAELRRIAARHGIVLPPDTGAE